MTEDVKDTALEQDVPEFIQTVDQLQTKLKAMRKAQAVFATYSQEQVDKIFKAAAIAANKARIPLAKMAVEETGMGIVEDKVIKNNYAAEHIYNAYKNEKTCGVIEENPAFGTKIIAEPLGLVAAVIPTTNPTSTAIFKTLICLKTRNAIIISPHPRAKKSTIAAAKIVLDAAVEAGAPEDIIGWIDVPSLELTNEVMRDADTILATGGPGMVRSAYSSGKPAIGVGAGNASAIIDSSADIINAVNSIIHSKTFDNGMICATEQTVIAEESIYDAVKEEFIKRGCYFLNDEEADKIRNTMLINGSLNARIVGQRPVTIAKMAGFEVPEKTKVLIGEATSTEPDEAFGHEKLTTILGMYKSKDFSDSLIEAVSTFGGCGMRKPSGMRSGSSMTTRGGFFWTLKLNSSVLNLVFPVAIMDVLRLSFMRSMFFPSEDSRAAKRSFSAFTAAFCASSSAMTRA